MDCICCNTRLAQPLCPTCTARIAVGVIQRQAGEIAQLKAQILELETKIISSDGTAAYAHP
jgi:hypothetical protein